MQQRPRFSSESAHTTSGHLPPCSMVEQQSRFSPCAGAAQHQGGQPVKERSQSTPWLPMSFSPAWTTASPQRTSSFRQPTSSRHTRRQQTLTLLVPVAGGRRPGAWNAAFAAGGEQRRAGVSAEPCLKGAGEPRSLQQREGGSRCSDAQRLAVWIAGRNLLAGESALGGVSQALASHGRGALPPGSTMLRTCSPVLSHLRLAGTP